MFFKPPIYGFWFLLYLLRLNNPLKILKKLFSYNYDISLLTNKKVYLKLYFTLLQVFKSALFLKHSGCSQVFVLGAFNFYLSRQGEPENRLLYSKTFQVVAEGHQNVLKEYFSGYFKLLM